MDASCSVQLCNCLFPLFLQLISFYYFFLFFSCCFSVTLSKTDSLCHLRLSLRWNSTVWWMLAWTFEAHSSAKNMTHSAQWGMQSSTPRWRIMLAKKYTVINQERERAHTRRVNSFLLRTVRKTTWVATACKQKRHSTFRQTIASSSTLTTTASMSNSATITSPNVFYSSRAVSPFHTHNEVDTIPAMWLIFSPLYLFYTTQKERGRKTEAYVCWTSCFGPATHKRQT